MGAGWKCIPEKRGDVMGTPKQIEMNLFLSKVRYPKYIILETKLHGQYNKHSSVRNENNKNKIKIKIRIKIGPSHDIRCD